MTSVALASDDDDSDYGKEFHQQVSLPQLPGYEVVKMIGKRDVFVVYRARQRSLGREVAIRTHHSGMALNQGKDFLRREAEILARVQHPNVISILDCVNYKDRGYIVLGIAQGRTLQSFLANHQQQHPMLAASLIVRLARTLSFVHGRGITHCNLHPGNILLAFPSDRPADARLDCLLGEDILGVPVIGGFSQAIDKDGHTNLTESPIRRIPEYMAPEQEASRCGDIGPATDIYALGAILYTMLAGPSRIPWKYLDARTGTARSVGGRIGNRSTK